MFLLKFLLLNGVNLLLLTKMLDAESWLLVALFETGILFLQVSKLMVEFLQGSQ